MQQNEYNPFSINFEQYRIKTLFDEMLKLMRIYRDFYKLLQIYMWTLVA